MGRSRGNFRGEEDPTQRFSISFISSIYIFFFSHTVDAYAHCRYWVLYSVFDYMVLWFYYNSAILCYYFELFSYICCKAVIFRDDLIWICVWFISPFIFIFDWEQMIHVHFALSSVYNDCLVVSMLKLSLLETNKFVITCTKYKEMSCCHWANLF